MTLAVYFKMQLRSTLIHWFIHHFNSLLYQQTAKMWRWDYVSLSVCGLSRRLLRVCQTILGLSVTSQHQSLQIVERRSSFPPDGTLHFYCGCCEFILLDGLFVATQSWALYIWFEIQWMPLLWFLCHLLNEFPAFGMMPNGVWFNPMEIEENNIYNSVVICALKRKHSISVLKCTLMYIQKRCNIHKSFTNKNVEK